jgi:hypothetical protein
LTATDGSEQRPILLQKTAKNLGEERRDIGAFSRVNVFPVGQGCKAKAGRHFDLLASSIIGLAHL